MLVKLKLEWSKISMSRLILINTECWRLELFSYRQPPALYDHSTPRYYFFSRSSVFCRRHSFGKIPPLKSRINSCLKDISSCYKIIIVIIITITITTIIVIIVIIIIIIKSLFNVGHIHLQNFNYIAQANKNQPWNIIDIIITLVICS